MQKVFTILVALFVFCLEFSSTHYQNHHIDRLDFSFDKSANKGLFAKAIPTKLRTAITASLDRASVSDFVTHCIRNSKCTQNQVIGGRRFSFRVSHRRGIMHFWQVYDCTMNHRSSACPIDGHWSKWSLWSPCTESCGVGVKTRKRACSNPPPANYGKHCSGRASERKVCTSQCPKNYSELAGDDPLRLRALKNLQTTEDQYPKIRGHCSKDHCSYHEVQDLIGDGSVADQYWLSLHCIERFVGCPVDGGWSDWKPWSSCSSECGLGERFRLRRCNDPPPSNGGIPCHGEVYEKEDCLGALCSNGAFNNTNPQWTEWSDWTTCTATSCQTYGTQYSRRRCIGMTKNATCDDGEGQLKKLLERKKPCVMKGCISVSENKGAQNVTGGVVKKFGSSSRYLPNKDDWLEGNSDRISNHTVSPHRGISATSPRSGPYRGSLADSVVTKRLSQGRSGAKPLRSQRRWPPVYSRIKQKRRNKENLPVD